MKQTVDTECSSCGGTGLYCGMCEPKGTAVICCRCGGTGCEKISYTPFTRRKGKQGVNTVSWSRGTFILNAGPGKASVSYRDFENGVLPERR